jgi:mannosyltransferase
MLSSDTMLKDFSRQALVGITLLGLFLSIYSLGSESLWRDEIHSVGVASLTLPEIIEKLSLDFHPPLYFFLLHYWRMLFGVSEFSARFLSVIFSSLTVIGMYRVGVLLFSRKVGFFGALLLALSEFHIQYAQEARAYSLLAFLTVLSFSFFIQFLQRGGSIGAIGYIVSSALLLYTHAFGLFPIVSQNIYWVLLFLWSDQRDRERVRQWVTLQIVLFLFYAPWLGVTVAQTLRFQSASWIDTPTLRSIVNTFSTYSGSRFSLAAFLLIFLTSAVIREKTSESSSAREESLLRQYWVQHGRLSTRAAVSLLFLWLLIPILLPFVISQFVTPLYLTRATIGASLAWYILAAKGLESLGSRKILQLALVSLIVCCSVVNVWRYHSKIKKEQWREVANYVDTYAKRENLLLFYEAGLCRSAFDYYSRRTGLMKQSLQDIFLNIDEIDKETLQQSVGNYDTVWIILCNRGEERKKIEQVLRGVSTNVLHKQYVKLDLLRFTIQTEENVSSPFQ